jgi:hypothetical protein
MTARYADYITRFHRSYIAEPNSGCFIWLLWLDKKGYGRIRVGDRMISAHRVAWQIENGDIPSELEVDHICRVRCCVNVRHLRLLSHRDNVLCGTGLTARYAQRTHCKHGHELIEKNLYKRDGWRLCRQCAIERYEKARQLSGHEYGPDGRRTHCKHGHQLSGDNLRVNHRGWRTCIACQRARDKARAPKPKRETHQLRTL